MRLSIIVEWANTRRNGVARAWSLLGALGLQWRAIAAHALPETLAPASAAFLHGLDSRAELLIMSGTVLEDGIETELRGRAGDGFDLAIHVADGLEYYPLKNLGARLATGDLLLFVDSDVLPDPGWLAHLLSSFGQPGVDAACAQTYVAPIDLISRSFALFWTYALRGESTKLYGAPHFYANTLAIRREVFLPEGFPSIGPRRTRGGCSLFGEQLARRGIAVWENQHAAVAHPPPYSLRHMVVRGIAHGRDHYMKRSDERSWYGLARSQAIAVGRLGRGFYRTFRDWRRVRLRIWEVPAALTVCTAYFVCFAVGGLLTHLSPEQMGRRFRV